MIGRVYYSSAVPTDVGMIWYYRQIFRYIGCYQDLKLLSTITACLKAWESVKGGFLEHSRFINIQIRVSSIFRFRCMTHHLKDTIYIFTICKNMRNYLFRQPPIFTRACHKFKHMWVRILSFCNAVNGGNQSLKLGLVPQCWKTS